MVSKQFLKGISTMKSVYFTILCKICAMKTFISRPPLYQCHKTTTIKESNDSGYAYSAIDVFLSCNVLNKKNVVAVYNVILTAIVKHN